MNITLKRIGMLSLLAMALPAQAHKLWLLPSHTSVSEPQWVTVDASISNEIFGVERAYPLDNLEVTGPDGKAATVENRLEGHRRSVFDVKLNKPGSYRIAVARPGYLLMYQVDGERKRARGMDADRAWNWKCSLTLTTCTPVKPHSGACWWTANQPLMWKWNWSPVVPATATARTTGS